MTKRVKNIITVLALIALLSFIGCEQLQEDYYKPNYKNPIKIGIVGDVLIGREVAENIFFAVKMATDEINFYGGIDFNGEKRKIQLVLKDSEGIAEAGIQVVNELIKEDIEFIIGPTISAVAVEMANACIENNILMMTYSATIPDISNLQDNDLIWRTCPSDAFSGKVMSEYSYELLNHKKAAILFRDDNFGNAMANVITEKFESLGGNVVASAHYSTNIDFGTYNYNNELNSLLAYEPDVIFAAVFEKEIGKITQDLWYSSLYQNYSQKPNLFLTEGAFPNELLSNGQPEVLETILGISSSITNTPNFLKYKNNYITKYGFKPNTYSEHAYDALYCIAYAIQKSQSTSANDVKNALRDVTNNTSPNQEDVEINVNEFDKAVVLLNSGININYNGASGKIDFDQNGDPNSTSVIWGFLNKEYTEIIYIEK